VDAEAGTQLDYAARLTMLEVRPCIGLALSGLLTGRPDQRRVKPGRTPSPRPDRRRRRRGKLTSFGPTTPKRFSWLRSITPTRLIPGDGAPATSSWFRSATRPSSGAASVSVLGKESGRGSTTASPDRPCRRAGRGRRSNLVAPPSPSLARQAEGGRINVHRFTEFAGPNGKMGPKRVVDGCQSGPSQRHPHLRSDRSIPFASPNDASVDPTEVRNDILGCFGRSDRSAQRHPWLRRSITPKRAAPK
jgi:hypothetical protein